MNTKLLFELAQKRARVMERSRLTRDHYKLAIYRVQIRNLTTKMEELVNVVGS